MRCRFLLSQIACGKVVGGAAGGRKAGSGRMTGHSDRIPLSGLPTIRTDTRVGQCLHRGGEKHVRAAEGVAARDPSAGIVRLMLLDKQLHVHLLW